MTPAAVVHADGHGRVGRGVFQSIIQKLLDRQLKEPSIDRDCGRVFVADDIQGPAIDHIVHRGDHLADEFTDVRWFCVNPDVCRVQPSHLHGVIDEFLQMLRFLIGDLEQLRLAFSRLIRIGQE